MFKIFGLKSIIKFQKEPTVPLKTNEMLELIRVADFLLIRVADFLGMTEFLKDASERLDIGMDSLLNTKQIQQVQQVKRGQYCLSKYRCWCYMCVV